MQVSFADYKLYNIRAAAVLTNAFVAGTVLGPDELLDTQNQVVIYLKLTLGALNNASLKIETSHDNTNWYQETYGQITAGIETDSLGVHTMGASGNYRIPFQLKDRFLRVSVLGTGNVAGSSAQVDVVIGTA